LFQRFTKAAEDVKNLNATPTDEELLELYALYKQGLVGDVNTGKWLL
jgi:diazepam-binding inhibitor (GABA receptor modulating acyl-CoA-binding protein)